MLEIDWRDYWEPKKHIRRLWNCKNNYNAWIHVPSLRKTKKISGSSISPLLIHACNKDGSYRHMKNIANPQTFDFIFFFLYWFSLLYQRLLMLLLPQMEKEMVGGIWSTDVTVVVEKLRESWAVKGERWVCWFGRQWGVVVDISFGLYGGSEGWLMAIFDGFIEEIAGNVVFWK